MTGKDRQRVLARAKLERQMARRAAQAKKRRQLMAGVGAGVAVLVLAAVVVFLVITFWPSGEAKPPAPQANKPASGCVYAKDPNPGGAGARNVGIPSTTNVPKKGTQQVTLTTNLGPVEMTLDTAKAPCTVNSFTFLAGKKYFDDTPCHRLLNKGVFVLQCGDPTGTGMGGPGYQFGVENLPKGKTPTYPKGTLAMANSNSPDTNGSQFFMVYRDSAFPPDYTDFGKITKGFEIMEKIGAGGTTGENGDSPKTKVQITSVKVTAPAV